MQKLAKRLSAVMVAVFTLFSVLTVAPVTSVAASAAVKPIAKIALQPNATYTQGDLLQMKLQAPNYKYRVEYKVVIENLTTKAVTNLFGSANLGYYTKTQPSGLYQFPIHWAFNDAGTYRVFVYVRPANTKIAMSTYAVSSNFSVAAKDDSSATAEKAVAAYEAAPLATAADLTAVDALRTAAVQAVANVTDATAKAAFQARIDAMDAKVAAAKQVSVTTVSAVSATALKVSFSTAVADTSKYSFKVVRGTTTQTDVSSSFTATWSTDKTSATLDFGANMPADTYTVTAASTGSDLSATQNSGSAVVTAQAVTKITIPSQQLIKSGDGKSATTSYKVYDQYGNDMTSSVTSNLTVNVVVGPNSCVGTPDASTGTIKVTEKDGSAFASTDTTAVMTIVYAKNGVTASASLTLAAAATVNSMTFGNNILPSGYTAITAGLSTAVTIPVTVVDQYGNTITNTTTLASSLKVISSSSQIDPTSDVTFINDANGNAEVTVDTSSITSAQTVVLTFINSTSGLVWTKSLSIVMGATPTTIQVGDFSSATIAEDDSFVLPLTVLDQFGNTLTNAQIASNASKIEPWIDVNGFSSDYHINTNPSSSSYGKLVGTVDAAPGTYVLTFNSLASSTAGNFVTKTVTVSDARFAAYVSNNATINLMQGASKDLELAFKDQYGTAIAYGDPLQNTKSSNYHVNKYTATLTQLSGDAGSVTFDGTYDSVNKVFTNNPDYQDATHLAGTDVNNAADIYLNSDSLKTGSYKLTVSLIDTTTLATVSTSTTTINVVANNVAGLTYSVTALPTLAGDKSYTAASTDAYAHKIAVTAKDANGVSYVVNPADILSVTGDKSIVNIDGSTGAWYVAGNDISGLSADQSTTLSVLLNTQDGVKSLTVPVKVSQAAPVINTIDVMNGAVATGGTTDISDLSEALSYGITAASLKDGSATKTVYVIGQDQYGVWKNLDDTNASIFVNSTSIVPLDTFVLTTSGTPATTAITVNKAQDIKAGTTLNATIISGSASKQITIVLQ